MAPLVAGYLGAASRDLKAAAIVAATRDPDLASTAAHHLQQCTEKLAKALSVGKGRTVAEEHRLRETLDALMAADRNEPWVPRLTPFVAYDSYAEAPYPDATGNLSTGPQADELKEDIEKVRQLLQQARDELGIPELPPAPRPR